MASAGESTMPETEETVLQVPRCATYEELGNDLFKLTLTEENKAEVFEYGLVKLNGNQEEAATILHHLKRWSPSVGSLFTPRSASTILSTPFRLIYPNSDLPSFDETGLYVRQYMAVSYCWRSEDFLPKGYERYGSWPISKPFVDAIVGEKNHPRVGIWMDQLCIDQESSIDKQKSVAAMDVIYRSCIRLLVLLEDVYLDEQEAALHLKYDPTKSYDPAWRPSTDERVVLHSFDDKVNAAKWWQRAWCFHEFNVNEPWGDRRQNHEIHNATFIMNGPNGSTVKMKWWTLCHIMGLAAPDSIGQEIFVPIDAGDREPGYRGSLMARHNAVSRKGCMLLEDKMSIMINMSGLALAYQGQTMRSQDELQYISSLLALAAGEKYPLTMFNSQATPKLLDKPSWFQRHSVDEIAIPRFKRGSLHGIHRISEKEVELDMILLPHPLTWTRVQDADLAPTYKMFPDTIATTRIATYRPVNKSLTTASRPDAELDGPRRRFLASCILNGYDFTARLWKQLEQDVVGPNYNLGLFKDLAPNPSLISAAQELIVQLLPVTTLLGITAPTIFTLEDAHMFITWLTDPRSMYYIGVYAYHLDCDGKNAFITGAAVNANFHDGPMEELRAAVPTDLLDATCIPLRVWILRQSKTEDTVDKYRLVGKAMLLGEPDLRTLAEENDGKGEAVVSLQRVIVGG